MSLTKTNLVQKNVADYRYEINCHQIEDLSRKRSEIFVKDIFHRQYQVNLDEFYPLLLNLSSPFSREQEKNIIDENIYDLKKDARFIKQQVKEINAVAGIRSADSGSLFSEYYLSSKVEDYARCHLKQWILRKSIVEVGNFTPANMKQVPALITSMIGFLTGVGYSCVVFTGVSWVPTAFKRLGLPLHPIADANVNCLPKDIQQQWGESYYQHQPKVYLGDIKLGYLAMDEKLSHSNHKLSDLWRQSIELGQKFKDIELSA
jgi:hypothetical protein